MRKKIGFMSTVMVSGAFILAACNTPMTTSPGNDGAGQAGVTQQPTLDLTGQPGGAGAPGLFSTATPLGGAADINDINATATPDAGVTGGNQTATQAPQAGTDTQDSAQAGISSGLVRLSEVLQASVLTNGSDQVGQVHGALVTGAAISGTTGQEAGVNVEGPRVSYVAVDLQGNEDTATQPTAEVTTESPQGSANRAAAGGWTELAGQNDLVLVPWQAFRFDQSVNATAGLQSRLDIAAISAAPRFSANNPPDFGSASWNAPVDQYWASQGALVPVTGTEGAQIGQPVLLTAPFNGLSVSLGDDQTAVQVQDFLVDPNTGEIKYVVLTGGNLGQRYLPVPAGALNWNQVTTLGAESGLSVPQNFSLDVSNDMVQQAPAIDTLNNLGIDETTWRENVDTFWQDFLNTGSEQVK